MARVELEAEVPPGGPPSVPSTCVAWWFDGKRIEKQYPAPASALVLPAGDAVLVVEPYEDVDEDDAGDNAVIFEGDGTERVRLRHPSQPRWPYSRLHRCFEYAMCHGDDVELIVNDHNADFRYGLDPRTGELTFRSEAR